MMKPLHILIIYFGLIGSSLAAANCNGDFPNPLSDLCWECAFPIAVGDFPIINGSTPDTDNPAILCACPAPPPIFYRYGISVGFWEPARLIDATRKPGCFPNMGGMEIDLGSMGYGKTRSSDGSASGTFMHAHYYAYPIWAILSALVDNVCVSNTGFDMLWLSELDPTWNDDPLGALLTPEVILFANPLAQALCAADCVKATTGLPTDTLFWCGGCQGSIYPLTGNISAHIGGVQASTLIAARMLFKMHRQLMVQSQHGTGPDDYCMASTEPMMEKSYHRLQMINPYPQTSESLGCNPLGRTSIHYEWKGGEIPYAGEDWGYVVWKKRNCCVSF